MALVPPRVVGPLSECSTGVRVEGQVAGAHVEVFADGSKVAEGTASGGVDTFPLTDDLHEGDEVTATQTDTSGNTSDETPEPVEVQAEPDDVPPVAFRTETYECGECVWLDGLVPGATAEVEDGRGVLGSESSYDGHARIHLSDPFDPAEDPVARQTACGKTGPETPAPGPHLIPGAEHNEPQLPPPVVEADLLECEEDVTVHGVLPGAEVTLERSAGPNRTACFDRGRLQFPLANSLGPNETLRARQSMPACDVGSGGSEPETADPVNTVPEPDVMEPLCAGGTTVTVTGMHAGKRVEIVVVPPGGGTPPGAGTTYVGVAPDSTFDFPIPALPANADVYVRQRLCNQWSGFAGPFEVDDAPEHLEPPRIHPEPYECGTVVHVEDCHPGTRVYVYSQRLGAPIGSTQVYDTETDVEVAPTLQAGDELYAVARGCGDESDPSGTVPVHDLDELPPPTVEQPDDCGDDVVVTDVVPGARVEVHVDGVRLGGAASGDDTVTVTVGGDGLEAGDEVQARQHLCGRQSPMSPPVPVEEFTGRWRVLPGEQKAEILAVHAALLHTGDVVYFGGDQHYGRAVGSNVDNTRLFDVETHEVTEVTGLPDTDDLFCSGHSLLEDGRLVVGGGTQDFPDDEGLHHGHFPGIRASWLFEPGSGWTQAGDLATMHPSDVPDGVDPSDTGGRWYPTLVTLADGRSLALGGHPLDDDPRHTNESLELFDPSSETWSLVGSQDYDNVPGESQAGWRSKHYEYPRLHVLPGGEVLSVTSMEDLTNEAWQPYTDPTDWRYVVDHPPDSIYQRQAFDSTSVLLPLRHDDGFEPSVLVCGGETPYRLEPASSNPSWTPSPRNNTLDGGRTDPRREHLTATLLPTGTVFVEGGMVDPDNKSTAVRRPEVYDPGTDSWSADLPDASVNRNYHSVALLLPDGAVWTAGSNEEADAGPGGEDGVREYRIEVFEPWYFCEDRPVIADAPDRACHGESFTVESPDADRVEEIALVRCGSSTHAFNPDQRHVTVDFVRDGNVLSVTVPSDPAVAVPGYYLLFLLDGDGVPSEGEFVQVCSDGDEDDDDALPGGLVDWLVEFVRRRLRWLRRLPGRLLGS